MVAILSSQVANEFYNKTNIDVISLPPYDKLDTPVSTHADMLVSIIDDNIFVYNEYYEANKSLFSSLDEKYKIVKVKKACDKKYPNDIALNVLIIGNKIFCNIKNTAKEILEYAEKNGYELINISQGYSACSTLVIGDKSAITADKGVYKALLKENIKTLLITNDTIKLQGYNCGFIGGCGGAYNKKVIFFGEIENHPDFDKINDFLSGENCTYISVSNGDVYDFGGIKFLEA